MILGLYFNKSHFVLIDVFFVFHVIKNLFWVNSVLRIILQYYLRFKLKKKIENLTKYSKNHPQEWNLPIASPSSFLCIHKLFYLEIGISEARFTILFALTIQHESHQRSICVAELYTLQNVLIESVDVIKVEGFFSSR